MLHPPSLSDWSQSEWSWYKQARLFPRLCLHWETPEQHYQSAGFPLHCKVTHYSSLFYTEKLQHACACPCTCMHVCKIAVMLGHDKNPERLQALTLNCSFRYSLISFALTVWLNLFSLSTFVFFFFLSPGTERVLPFTPTATSSAIWQCSHKPIKPALSSVLQHGRQDSQKL